MGKVIYRVKKINPNTWQLKTRGAFGKKKVGNVFMDKEIGYFPGKESPFVEDNPGVKQAEVPAFVFSDFSQRTQLLVSETNIALINYLEAHPWFNTKFEKYDANEEATKKLESFNKIEDALALLRDKSGEEILALGLLVIGSMAINMGEINVRKELKEIAFSKPDVILNVTQNLDFDTLFIGAKAFVNGIVTTNETKTAVVWTDNKGVIVRVAKGENPIENLGKFLVLDTEESRVTLQEIGNRIGYVASENSSNGTDDKDAKIAELEAKLRSLQATNLNTNTAESIETEEDLDSDDIESLREKYEEKFGKEVAPVKKNDAGWIKAKLTE